MVSNHRIRNPIAKKKSFFNFLTPFCVLAGLTVARAVRRRRIARDVTAETETKKRLSTQPFLDIHRQPRAAAPFNQDLEVG